MDTVKYPEVKVKLTGKDGNAFVILGEVITELRRAEISEVEIKKFIDEATSGDYDNLLVTAMSWVQVS